MMTVEKSINDNTGRIDEDSFISPHGEKNANPPEGGDKNDANTSKIYSKSNNRIASNKFLSIHLSGTIDIGHFESVNDVYVKYSIVTGPDWLLASGSDVGITQISRFKKDENSSRRFVWNQPVAASYRSYNYFGWPQIILSVYYFDTFGNDQILGYGCIHLPISGQVSATCRQKVIIYAPQSSSMFRQILSWIVGRRPELVDSNLLARADCRSLLQMNVAGQIEINFSLTSKDVNNNGYRT